MTDQYSFLTKYWFRYNLVHMVECAALELVKIIYMALFHPPLCCSMLLDIFVFLYVV